MRTILAAIVCLLIAAFIGAQFITIFVIQSIGALPEGRTIVINRLTNLNFIDSPDGFCERQMGSVSLLCRDAVAARVANQANIIVGLPYSETIYSIRTGGKSYEISILQSVAISALAVIFFCGSVLSAEVVQLIVHAAKAGNVYGEVLIKIKNTSDRTIQRVSFNCGVFSKSGVLTGADDSFSDPIPPKESEYKRLLIGIDSGPTREVDSAKCRITSVR